MFSRATVDSILSDVNKLTDKLQALAETEKANALQRRLDAQAALSAAEASEAEADRALRITAKIEDLLV